MIRNQARERPESRCAMRVEKWNADEQTVEMGSHYLHGIAMMAIILIPAYLHFSSLVEGPCEEICRTTTQGA